eukprot:TRINITY_DN6584_c0_g1_i1.p2 TRINITY_DN6584_c0_g1~~TRINITY_DN6584_c0_g1_i1.p2  ORF type:complete len:241 (+),score=63.65 TRINITY_DN6584_c0_g1_i1:882-1604(+)
MSWMLDGKDPKYPKWTDYFELVIVDAEKPAFFIGQKEFRLVDQTTGNKQLGKITKFQKSAVYSGGNLKMLEKLAGIKAGNSVLYVGDHIFSDVMISKKKHAWRTLLIIPELYNELVISSKNGPNILKMIELDLKRTETFNSLPVDSNQLPDIKELKDKLREASQNVDTPFNKHFGSMFRSGLHLSFFQMQVSRYADLYTTSVCNFLNYSMVHHFQPQFANCSHEVDTLNVLLSPEENAQN